MTTMASSTRPVSARHFHLLRVTAWGILLMAWGVAHAATLYVDNSCPTSGDGTTTSCGSNGPFRTIGQAMSNSQLTAGSTLRVRATGISYVEGTLNTPRAGTASARLTVTRYVGDTGKPVWTRSAATLMLTVDDAFWTFDNIDFTATAAAGDIARVSAANVSFTNCAFREGGVAVNIFEAGDNTTVDNCIFDGNGNGTTHAITTGRSPDPTAYTLTGIQILNSTFTNGDQDYIQLFQDSALGCRQATVTGLIDGNSFTYGAGQGENALDIKTKALVGDPLIVSNNTFTGWNGDGTLGKPVVIQHCPDYVHFNYNTVNATTTGPGSNTCSSCIGVILSCSEVNGGTGVSGLEVIGNTFYNVKYAIQTGEGDGFPATGDTILDIKIWNNTASKLRTGGVFHRATSDILGGEIRNNLADLSATTNGKALDCGSAAWTVTALIESNNGWYGDSTEQASCSADDCTGEICDTSDTTGTDPLFTNRAADDYTLQATSTAINAGINVGLPFMGAAPDLGAYETTGGPPDTTPPAAPTGLVVTQ